MATSGDYSGDVYGGESSYFTWQLLSQDQVANTSRIAWQIGWRFLVAHCRGLRNGGAVVNGSLVYWDVDSGDGVHTFSSSHNHQPKLQTGAGEITIAHDEDGDKTVEVTFTLTGWYGGGPNAISGDTVTFDLPTIARYPDAPSAPIIGDITGDSVSAFLSGGTPDATVDSWQVRYATNLAATTDVGYQTAAAGANTITGLANSTTYYFWARRHNPAGYGPWSAPYPVPVTTYGPPDPPSQPVLSNLAQTSVTVSWTENDDHGVTVTGRELRYGTDSSGAGATVVSGAASPWDITDLIPGTTYYFWVRVQNTIGWSAWSPPQSTTAIAGARVKYSGVFKMAIPYVRYEGVWRVARPIPKNFGEWKPAI
jgi:Siphovirus protein of unknown function (DUF859)./Fibronectin type III domain.